MTKTTIGGLALDVIVALVELDSYSDVKSARVTLQHILNCAEYESIGTKEEYYTLTYECLELLGDVYEYYGYVSTPQEEEIVDTVITKLKVFLNNECGIVIEG